jgi:hypothetical protein
VCSFEVEREERFVTPERGRSEVIGDVEPWVLVRIIPYPVVFTMLLARNVHIYLKGQEMSKCVVEY